MKSEASVSMITGLSGLKCARIGSVVNRVFNSLKADSAFSFHAQFFPAFFFVSSVSGRATRE